MKLSKYKLLTTLFLIRRWSLNQDKHLINDKRFLSSLVGPNYSQTLSRLKTQGLISTRSHLVGPQGETLEITYRGVNDLLLRFPLLDYLDKSGDQKLTLVVFNINEKNRKERDRLRYNLKALGFGCLNRSLYLSPHLSVKEAGHLLVSSVEDKPDGFLPSTRRVGESADQSFAFSVPFESFQNVEKMSNFWQIEAVADLYERALAVWASGLGSDPGTTGRFLSKFVEALLVDPLLPPLLLPKNWVGRQALEMARNIVCN